jgi:hypothetical protein
VAFIKVVVSCLRDYKASNGVYETDGKLLAWIALEAVNMPKTKKVCHWILKRKFGEQWVNRLFEIKLPWPDNPIRIALESH